MKLIDEIIEVLEEQSQSAGFIDIENTTIKEFLSFENKKSELHSGIKPYSETLFQTKATLNSVRESSDFNYNKAEPVAGDFHNMKIDQLRQYVLSCRKCRLCDSRTNVVFGEGNPNADLMFIGEAPGRDEDLQGKPFVGKSGQLLTKMVNAMGYTREEVYIANIIKCRPPYNRNPSPEEAKYCLDFLNRQIELIDPKVIVLLGAVPLHFLLGLIGITRLHGQWKEFNGIKTMPTFHPAFLLRDPRQKKPAWEDLQKVMKVLGKL